MKYHALSVKFCVAALFLLHISSLQGGVADKLEAKGIKLRTTYDLRFDYNSGTSPFKMDPSEHMKYPQVSIVYFRAIPESEFWIEFFEEIALAELLDVTLNWDPALKIVATKNNKLIFVVFIDKSMKHGFFNESGFKVSKILRTFLIERFQNAFPLDMLFLSP